VLLKNKKVATFRSFQRYIIDVLNITFCDWLHSATLDTKLWLEISTESDLAVMISNNCIRF